MGWDGMAPPPNPVPLPNPVPIPCPPPQPCPPGQALELLERAYGEKHWLYVSTMHNLALMFEAMGRTAQAHDTMTKVTALRLQASLSPWGGREGGAGVTFGSNTPLWCPVDCNTLHYITPRSSGEGGVVGEGGLT